MELYKKRQMQIRGEFPDVYQYEEIPEQLAVQLVYIIEEILEGKDKLAWSILKRIAQEFGLPGNIIDKNFKYNFYSELNSYSNILIRYSFSCQDIEITSSVFELCLCYASEELVEKFNRYCLENGFGLQFNDGQLIRIDNQFIHKEVVINALSVLNSGDFKGAQEEFLQAHNEYLHRNNQNALVNALKSIESTIKIICNKQHWQYNATDTIKKLLQICFDHQLIPDFWQSHMNGLRAILEGGVPTARNKLGGHGQGCEIVEVPDYLVAYVLHMTASTIVFLADAEKNI